MTGPKISFSLPQRKLLGNGDKWFNDIYLSYNLSYDHGKETFVKNSCIDNDLDGNCDTETDDDLTSNEIIWSANSPKSFLFCIYFFKFSDRYSV